MGGRPPPMPRRETAMREIVRAEVVWVATLNHLDCEGRYIQSRESTDHDTEGDGRRHLVSLGLGETERWGVKDWRSDTNPWVTGSLTRVIRELKETPRDGE